MIVISGQKKICDVNLVAKIEQRLGNVNVEIYHLAMNFDLIDSAVVNPRRNRGYNTNGGFQVLMRECVFLSPFTPSSVLGVSDAFAFGVDGKVVGSIPATLAC